MGTMTFILGAVAGAFAYDKYKDMKTKDSANSSAMFEGDTVEGAEGEESTTKSGPKHIDLKINVDGKEYKVFDTSDIKKILD
ncbi:MAG: hypothetical protein HUJ71_08735 [Pseudobutyrivibrio sp.]|nr:hypothetical protein [Pseudobutyrivibrio sp.]